MSEARSEHAEKMKKNPALFIDTNQYLDLYLLKDRAKLLDQLHKYQQYLFITQQITEELFRNSFNKVEGALQLQRLLINAIPVHLLEGKEDLDTIRKALKEFQNLKKTVSKVIEDTLDLVSRSEDECSKSLEKLFRHAIAHTPEQLRRARDRKERGNPPGKHSNPLGDQISWEQILDNAKSLSELWLVTKDSDYFADDSNEILKPLLHRELMAVNNGLKIHCFGSLGEAITDFSEAIGKEKSLTDAEVKEIKEEQDSFPPVNWSNYIVQNPPFIRSANVFTSGSNIYPFKPTNIIVTSSGSFRWSPEPKPDPDKDKK